MINDQPQPKTSPATLLALQTVPECISELTNVEPHDIIATDSLEEDLFLDVDTDVPKILALVNKRLGLPLKASAIAEFIKEIHQEPEKGTVGELVDLFSEEMEFA